MAVEETRRCEAKAYIDAHPDNWWVVHPNGINEPELRMEPGEVLHSLPCCDGAVQPPPLETARMIVNATVEINVRVAPSLDADVVTKLKRGVEVTVVAGTSEWAQLIEPHGGRFVFRSLLRPM